MLHLFMQMDDGRSRGNISCEAEVLSCGMPAMCVGSASSVEMIHPHIMAEQ